MSNTATQLRKVAVATGRDDYVAVLNLSRPEVANALSAALIGELTAHLNLVAADQNCRALVLRGSGKHFSAGADLGWMKEAASLDYDGNLRDSEQLIRLFEALANLPFPSLACVHGSAFGGAVGLAAACDVVLAVEGARFCLSEVKLGLIPAVILPYLVRKVAPGSLRYWAVTGRLISPSEALGAGLVQRVVAPAELDQALHEELNTLLQAAPEAQSAVKTLLREVIASGAEQGPYTAAAIAKARVSASGRAGLAAFFTKSSPSWAIQLAPNWRLD
jgi:methylglutaconyl-CoA hydratase